MTAFVVLQDKNGAFPRNAGKYETNGVHVCTCRWLVFVGKELGCNPGVPSSPLKLLLDGEAIRR